MESMIISNEKLQIEYYVKGSGEEDIICLHGHGRSVDDFDFLNTEFHRLILIVLPHHGKSNFPEESIEREPLTVEAFNQIFEMIIQKESIADFHFVAFSQGGRFVLSLVPFQKNKIKSIHLISPDAMDYNSFYNRASRNWMARRLMKSFEQDPQRFISGARFFYNIGLVRPKVFSFIQKFAATKESFRRASITWRGFRKIKTDMKAIEHILSSKPFRFIIIMGRYDQVIRTKQARLFLKKINQPDALIEIECGHNFFKQENISLLMPHIQIKKDT